MCREKTDQNGLFFKKFMLVISAASPDLAKPLIQLALGTGRSFGYWIWVEPSATVGPQLPIISRARVSVACSASLSVWA